MTSCTAAAPPRQAQFILEAPPHFSFPTPRFAYRRPSQNFLICSGKSFFSGRKKISMVYVDQELTSLTAGPSPLTLLIKGHCLPESPTFSRQRNIIIVSFFLDFLSSPSSLADCQSATGCFSPLPLFPSSLGERFFETEQETERERERERRFAAFFSGGKRRLCLLFLSAPPPSFLLICCCEALKAT